MSYTFWGQSSVLIINYHIIILLYYYIIIIVFSCIFQLKVYNYDIHLNFTKLGIFYQMDMSSELQDNFIISCCKIPKIIFEIMNTEHVYHFIYHFQFSRLFFEKWSFINNCFMSFRVQSWCLTVLFSIQPVSGVRGQHIFTKNWSFTRHKYSFEE